MKSIYHLVWLQFFLQTINAIDNENLAINEKEIVLTTDASHPAIIAAEKISDIEIRSEITDLFHKNSILWNRLIGWFKHEVCDPEKATAILENWRQCRIEERPILDVKKFFSQERVKLENLEEYLVTNKQEPFFISGDEHVAIIQIKEEAGTVIVDFYDPYELSDDKSYLSMKIREIADRVYYPKNERLPKWRPHYTKHQKLTAMGECTLYAAEYYNLLLAGHRPESVSEGDILTRVTETKKEMREENAQYFEKYDKLFQFMFISNFAELLLEEIWKLPENWGTEKE